MTIDRLLKKNNLTGWDIGRIMIADLLEIYKKQLNGDIEAKEGILSEKDKVTLIHGIETVEDSKKYGLFKYVHDFLTTIPMRIAYNQQLFENNSFKLHHILSLTKLAEEENTDRIYHTPLVVSPSQYEDIKASYQTEEKAKQYTPEELFFNELERLVDLYNRGEAPESFYNIIKAMESEPIDNKRIIENFYTVAPKYSTGEGGYYQTKDGKRQEEVDPVLWFELLNFGEIEFIQENQLKEEFLKVWLLPINSDEICYRDCIKGFYYSGCTGDTKTFTEFKQDYPAIYDYVWAILLKAIPALKECTGAKLFKPCITGEELYSKDILNYRYKIDSEVNKRGYRSIAVLQHPLYTTHSNDTNYSYTAPSSILFDVYRAEKLLDQQDTIESLIKQMGDALTEINCTNVLLEILANRVDLPDIYNLLKTDTTNYTNTIYYMNERLKELIEWDIVRNGTEPIITDRDYKNHTDTKREPIAQDELRAIVSSIFPLIDYRLYEPSQNIIDSASRSFDFEKFYGKANGVIETLIAQTKNGSNKANEKGGL